MLCFGSKAVRCQCFCRRLTNFFEATCWGVDISYVPPYGDLTAYNMHSVRCFQLLELLTFSVSPTFLIPYSIDRLIAVEFDSSVSMPFTLGMDDDSSRLIAELSG